MTCCQILKGEAPEVERDERLTADFRQICATERVMSQFSRVRESLNELCGAGFADLHPGAASTLTLAAVLAELAAEDRALKVEQAGALRVELSDIGIALREG